jgi:rhodanese-related sulfurtransferase
MNLPLWLPFGHVPEISAIELSELVKNGGAQLIDVRTPAEFVAGHVAGARNVPINTFKQMLPKLALDPKRPIVAICATAHRSPPAVRLLRAAGYENAAQLKNGMLSWYAAKLPTSRKQNSEKVSL